MWQTVAFGWGYGEVAQKWQLKIYVNWKGLNLLPPLSWKLKPPQERQSTQPQLCEMKCVCLNHLSDHLTMPLEKCAWIKMYSFLWIFQVVMASENKHHVARVDPAPALVQPLPRGLQCGRSEIRTFCMEVVILVSHCWQLPLGRTPWIALTHILSLLQPQELCSGWKPEHRSFYLWK